jgi:signal transduction histidine kinase
MTEDMGMKPFEYAAMLEQIQDVVFRWGPAGFEFVNSALERLTGYVPSAFYDGSVSWDDIVYEDDRMRLNEALRATLKGDIPSEPLPLRLRDADGSPISVELLISAPKDSSNQTVNGIMRIDYGRLVERERRQGEISESLLKISTILARSLHLDLTLSHILEQLEGLIPFDSATIFLVSNRSQKLRMVSARGIPNANVTIMSSKEVDSFPLDETVLATARPLIVPDVRQDPRWRPLRGTEYIRSYLGVPLLARDGPIGLVTVDRRVPDSFLEADAKLAAAFAQHATAAIENARLFSEVSNQERRLHSLLNKVVTAQEEERRRISRELHDEMGQALTAIKLNLQMVLAALAGEDAELQGRLEEVVGLSANTLQEVRRLAMDLRPSILDDLGLIPTLRWYVDSFQKRTNIVSELRLPESSDRLSSIVETALYRVVQEALTNVSRHAEASHVALELYIGDSALSLSIADDGKGFDLRGQSANEVMGLGLSSMQERIDDMGGSFSINSHPGRGTRILISIPAVVAFQPS